MPVYAYCRVCVHTYLSRTVVFSRWSTFLVRRRRRRRRRNVPHHMVILSVLISVRLDVRSVAIISRASFDRVCKNIRVLQCARTWLRWLGPIG